MKKILTACALTLALGCTTAFAQYTGPNDTATTVKQIQDAGKDNVFVTLQGKILSRVGHENLYKFNDGSGEILIKISDKIWPAGLQVNEKSRVEITGKYIKETLGMTKIEVSSLKPLN